MTQTTDTRFEIAKWLGGAAAGALLMYMLDPDRGGTRRAQSVAAVRNAGARTSDAVGKALHAAGKLAQGARPAVGAAADHAVAATGSALARMGQAAGAALDDGITGAGDALQRGGTAVSAAVADAVGDAVSTGTARACEVLGRAGAAIDDRYAGARRGARRLRARVRDAVQAGPDGAWAPPVRTSALAGGGLLALYGLARRSPFGLLLGVAGAVLLARSASNQPLSTLRQRLHLGRDQTIDIENSIHIDAAPDEVYDTWMHYANFSKFMANVVDVRDLGHGRSHWTVKGPAGSAFEWTSRLTEQSRPHRLAWRSEAGADVPQSGSVTLAPHRGGTHVTVRMSYTPPAGALGQGLAGLLGADPKAGMDADLARLKAFIERGTPPYGHAGARPDRPVLH